MRLPPNQVWAMDFVHDQLFDGTKIRVLTIVDAFTRVVPVLDVRLVEEAFAPVLIAIRDVTSLPAAFIPAF